MRGISWIARTETNINEVPKIEANSRGVEYILSDSKYNQAIISLGTWGAENVANKGQTWKLKR